MTALRARLAARFGKDESGAVLVLALAFVVFVGVIGVATLEHASTNLRATSRLRPVRALQFSADGAMEGAINKMRLDPSLACGERFYRADPPINDIEIAVNAECTATATPFVATFTARQCETTDTSAECNAKRKLIVAQVRYEGVIPNVTTNVLSWSAT